MRCLLYKTQEINGERRSGDERTFVNTLKKLSADFESHGAAHGSAKYIDQSVKEGKVLSSRGSGTGDGTSLYADNRNNSCSTVGLGTPPNTMEEVDKSVQPMHRNRTILIPKVDC